jgi:hypothetical protein|tara:strand:+ start:3419 stop:3961 length:543 start_codon:yes stop_codon:yes gene_type:complete
MSSRVVDKIKHASNTEVVRKLLIHYFIQKGFVESFDRMLYPSLLQDLPMMVPQLENKIEVKPHVVELDPSVGKAVLGWNLFVLGSHRIYLGESHHDDLIDLSKQISNGIIESPQSGYGSARRQSTPKKVVMFITRVLSDHLSGYVDLGDATGNNINQPYLAKGQMMGQSQTFFTKSGYGT